jgi:hypothetical protein
VVVVGGRLVFDAVIAILISLFGDGATRRWHREPRRRIKAAARPAIAPELLLLYQSLEPYGDDSSVRPAAILALADVDPAPASAEPPALTSCAERRSGSWQTLATDASLLIFA